MSLIVPIVMDKYPYTFNYLDFVKPIVKLINDKKIKVRFIASELLNLLTRVCNFDDLVPILRDNLETFQFNALQ